MRFAQPMARQSRRELASPTPASPERTSTARTAAARDAAAWPRYLKGGAAGTSATTLDAGTGAAAQADAAMQDNRLPEVQHQSPSACDEPLGMFPLLACYVSAGPHFDAVYLPSAPALEPDAYFVTHRVHVDFRSFSPELIAEQPDLFGGYGSLCLSEAQIAANAWTDAERETFRAEFRHKVSKAWSGQHVFATNEPCFARYRATPRVDVEFADDAQAAHSTLVAYKLPPNAARLRSQVVNGSAASLDSRDPTVETSHWTLPSELVRQVGPFDFGSADINGEVDADIHTVAAELRPRINPNDPLAPFGPDASIDFRGRASAEGSAHYNQDLARRRADAVRARVDQVLGLPPSRMYLGMEEPGEAHATTDAMFRRVDIRFWGGGTDAEGRDAQQNVAAHEFGHLIGLGDEYEEETPPQDVAPKFEGDRPRHYQDVEAAMGSAIANELLIQNSGSIMSQGGEVRRGHYVYFLNQLSAMTHKAWVIE